MDKTKFFILADTIFVWSFSVALVLAAVDWIRPLSVSPFFNVNWLIALAAIAFLVRCLLSDQKEVRATPERPSWILYTAVFIFSAAAARPLGFIAMASVALLCLLVVWTLTREHQIQ